MQLFGLKRRNNNNLFHPGDAIRAGEYDQMIADNPELMGALQKSGMDSGFAPPQNTPQGGGALPNPNLKRLFSIGEAASASAGEEGIAPTSSPQPSMFDWQIKGSEQEPMADANAAAASQTPQMPAANATAATTTPNDAALLRQPNAATRGTAQDILNEISAAEQSPAKREKSLFKRLGSGLWNGFKMWAENGGQGGLLGLVGAVGAGGGIFAASPEAQGEFKKQQNINKMWSRFGNRSKAETALAGNARRDALTNQGQQRVDQGWQRIEADKAKTALSKVNQQQATLLRQLSLLDNYKPGANAAFDKQLADAGINIGAFDNRRRNLKEQNGVWFEQDPETQNWRQVAGLPEDPTERPTVVSINGMQMILSPKQIAQLMYADANTVRQNTFNYGMQQDRQNFTAAEAEKQRVFRSQLQQDAQANGREQAISRAMTAYSNLYQRQNGSQPTADEIQQYRNFVEQQLAPQN
jgi:hypothetical protein